MIQTTIIQSSTRSWKDMFVETARRATTLGPGRLVGISHCCDESEGTVTLWHRPDGQRPQRWMRFWFVRSSTRTWASLFDEAADRAAGLAEGQLFTISHSCDSSDAVVAVWYWVDHNPAEQKALRGGVSLSPGGGGGLSEPAGDEKGDPTSAPR